MAALLSLASGLMPICPCAQTSAVSPGQQPDGKHRCCTGKATAKIVAQDCCDDHPGTDASAPVPSIGPALQGDADVKALTPSASVRAIHHRAPLPFVLSPPSILRI